MPTAIATIESLSQEMAALEIELQTLKAKRAAEERNLSALEIERGKISEAIALGTMKAAAATEHVRKIEQSRAAIDGLTAIITRQDKRYGAASSELSTLEAEARRAAEIKEIADLKSEAVASIARITDTLTQTLGVEIYRLNEIRNRLGKVMDEAARRGGFPIPAAALAAREARNTIEKEFSIA